MFSFLPTNRLLRHLLFWVAIALYFLIPQLIYPDYIDTVTHYFFNFNYEHSPYFLQLLFSYVLGVGMLYAYAFLRWAIPSLLAGYYVKGIGLYVLITCAICYLFRLIKAMHIAFLDPWLRARPFNPFDSRHFDDYFFNQVYIHEYSTIILILAVYKFFTNWQQKQQEASRLEREKITTEIRLLKTQINPDFLFDALLQLKTLTQQQSKQAPGLVLDLAQFLRYVLYDTNASTVPLGLEVSTLRHYVSLQRLLRPKDVEVSFTVRGPLEAHRIIPHSLLLLAEDAFQHLSSESDEPAWVSIDLAVAESSLILKVITGQSNSPTSNTNRLGSIQKQLNFHYGENCNLHIVQEPDAFIVTLTLSFPAASEPIDSNQSLLVHEATLSDR